MINQATVFGGFIQNVHMSRPKYVWQQQIHDGQPFFVISCYTDTVSSHSTSDQTVLSTVTNNTTKYRGWGEFVINISDPC